MTRVGRIAGAITAGTLLIAAPLSTAAVRARSVAAERHDPDSAVTVSASDPRIVYLGRWGRQGGAATTVNSGSRVLLRFSGRHVVGLFDQSATTFPPQVYARIDGSRPNLYDVDRDRIDFAPDGLAPGVHDLELIVKDVDERANRWVPPLQSGLTLRGFELAAGAGLAPRSQPRGRRIEFLGDSITQGVRALGPQIGVDGADATKDYAWLAGNAFGGNFRQVGFGAQGVVVAGNGGVPPAPQSLTLNYGGSPTDSTYVPDAVVVNQGTNDVLKGVTPTAFRAAYEGYLSQIRSLWPHAWIFALRPFGGYGASDISAAVTDLADARIVYVNTTGWVQPMLETDGLHPSFAGHVGIARDLANVISSHTGWRHGVISVAASGLLAAGAPPGFEGSAAADWTAGSKVSGVSVGVAASPAARPYEGENALQLASTRAPLGEWRTVSLGAGKRIHVPLRARDLFAFVSLNNPTVSAFDATITVTEDGKTSTATDFNMVNLAGFLPWNRIHVELPHDGGDITALSISVRAEGMSGTSGALPFQVDDVGWTGEVDG